MGTRPAKGLLVPSDEASWSGSPRARTLVQVVQYALWPLTAREALDAANDGKRVQRYETMSGPRGASRQERLASDPGRWTWCPDCLTVYDDYGEAVSRNIRLWARIFGGGTPISKHFATDQE